MSKPATFFKRTSNRLLRYVADNISIGDFLPSEDHLATVCQASRTTIRSAVTHLSTRGVVEGNGRERRIVRKPQAGDYFDVTELQTQSDKIRQSLMERVFNSDLPPGAEFSESELAREAGVSTVSVREFLIGFSRFGLIEKKPRGGWRLCAFDPRFAEELADMRQMFELTALEHFMGLPPEDPAWQQLERLLSKHQGLEPRMKTRFTEFPALDRDLHTLLVSKMQNRFAQEFYDIVSFVFHYHYQWNKSDEMERNCVAMGEHLSIIQAMLAHDTTAAMSAMRAHLKTARTSILNSLAARNGGLSSETGS